MRHDLFAPNDMAYYWGNSFFFCRYGYPRFRTPQAALQWHAFDALHNVKLRTIAAAPFILRLTSRRTRPSEQLGATLLSDPVPSMPPSTPRQLKLLSFPDPAK